MAVLSIDVTDARYRAVEELRRWGRPTQVGSVEFDAWDNVTDALPTQRTASTKRFLALPEAWADFRKPYLGKSPIVL